SCTKSTPPSSAAIRVPGARDPHGTRTRPSSATIADFTRLSPMCRSSGMPTITPRPKPVTDSANGVTPSVIRSTTRPRPRQASVSHRAIVVWAPDAVSTSASSTPPRMISTTSISSGPSVCVVSSAVSALIGNQRSDTIAATAIDVTAATVARTRRASRPHTRRIGAPAASVMRGLNAAHTVSRHTCLEAIPRLRENYPMSNPSAVELVTAVQDGSRDPVALIEEALARASAAARFDAIQQLFPEEALAAAAELAARSDLGTLPLAGLPVLIKDNMPVAGHPMRDGSQATSAEPSSQDHEMVRRMREAGAIIIGTTRVPELCVWASTDSEFGTTRNPWNPQFTPGGSSGGAAAAVAA